MYEGGIAKQRWSVSDTAEYGDYVSGPRVIDPSVKENMKAVLGDIQSGVFAQRFIEDQDAGAPEFKALRVKGEQHPIEVVGRQLRSMMSWVKSSNKDDYKEGSVARE
jgi:ketol-acid reductoisomerase